MSRCFPLCCTSLCGLFHRLDYTVVEKALSRKWRRRPQKSRRRRAVILDRRRAPFYNDLSQPSSAARGRPPPERFLFFPPTLLLLSTRAFPSALLRLEKTFMLFRLISWTGVLAISLAFASSVHAQIQFGAKTPPAAPSAGAFQLPAAKPLVTTTLSYTPARGGTQIIPVTLNGTVQANFIFDTGTNFSGISQTLVSRLKLPAHPAIGLDGLHVRVGGIPADAADVQFDIGSFRLPRSPFIVIGGTTLSALAGQTVDGIIGADQLTVTPSLLDVSKHQIMFLSHGFLSLADLRQLGMEDAVVVPVQDKGDDFLFKCLVRFRRAAHSTAATVSTTAVEWEIRREIRAHRASAPPTQALPMTAPRPSAPMRRRAAKKAARPPAACAAEAFQAVSASGSEPNRQTGGVSFSSGKSSSRARSVAIGMAFSRRNRS